MYDSQIPEMKYGDEVIYPSETIETIKQGQVVQSYESALTTEEKEAVSAFVDKIQLSNSQAVLLYGAESQKKIADFSNMTLNKIKTKDMGESGKLLSNLIVELNGVSFEEEKPKGVSRFFSKSNNFLKKLQTQYKSVEGNINHIISVLEGQKIQLLKDISMYDQMYDMNITYYKELTMYIIAGKQKLQQTLEMELPALKEKAKASGLAEDAQAVSDLDGMCSRFEKRLYDLELTRNISIQMAPQIRLIQNNQSAMVEKIHTALISTIPLWKNQMVLSLGIQHAKEASDTQKKVNDMTNELLKKNAETLKMTTTEVAEQAEHSIVDIETLKYTNETLISTLNDVFEIQEQGRLKRKEAEIELIQIENQLKEKLIELR